MGEESVSRVSIAEVSNAVVDEVSVGVKRMRSTLISVSSTTRGEPLVEPLHIFNIFYAYFWYLLSMIVFYNIIKLYCKTWSTFAAMPTWRL